MEKENEIQTANEVKVRSHIPSKKYNTAFLLDSLHCQVSRMVHKFPVLHLIVSLEYELTRNKTVRAANGSDRSIDQMQMS